MALGRGLILAGIVLVVLGAVVLMGQRLPWLGRLPGDMVIERDGFRLYVPIMTCVLLSLALSAVLWLVGRFRP